MENHNRLSAARKYLARGYQPLPVPERRKAPDISDWPNFRANGKIEEFFTGTGNIGVLLGEPSGGLIDVDLDAPEALSLASTFLPPTSALFGRASKPRSHCLYVVEPIPRTAKFQDPVPCADKAMLVELRSTGTQTIFPPSMHPSGEIVEWNEDGKPSHVGARELLHSVSRLAAAVLLVRHYPTTGLRHEFALALCGALARAGWLEDEIATFVQTLASAAGDIETRDRVLAANYSIERIHGGKAATGWPSLATIIGKDVAHRSQEWLAPSPFGQNREEVVPKAGRDSQATKLADLILDCQLFHAPDGTGYVTTRINGHIETLRIRSVIFRRLMEHRFYESEHKVPASQAIQDALNVVDAQARYDGPQHDVFVRVAGSERIIYVDLGDPNWTLVAVTPDGWSIANDPNVKFRRSSGMLSLPTPILGGSINELRLFLNLASDQDWTLVVTWMIAALLPRGPYPVLNLHGEQGTAKSTTARVIRSLIDPSTSPLRSLPHEERDMHVSAKHSHMLAYDNVSRIDEATSDALCRLATGGGLAKRQLYTDDEELLFEAQRPVLLTSISELAVQEDLIDRTISICLPGIVDHARLDERHFWCEFDLAKPQIFGALLSVMSAGLRNVENVRLERKPRLADFATWGVAVEPALEHKPETFLLAYHKNRKDANHLVLEGSLLAEPLLKLLLRSEHWEGPVTLLLGEINAGTPENIRREKRWPRTPRALSGNLRRLAPSLKAAGVTVTFPGREPGRGRSLVRLERLGVTPSQPSPPPGTLQPGQYPHITTISDKSTWSSGEGREGQTFPSASVASKVQLPVRLSEPAIMPAPDSISAGANRKPPSIGRSLPPLNNTG